MDGLVHINLNWGITLLTQTATGILGNSSLLCLYNFTFITAQRLRPTDLILNQLVLANNLVILSKGIPQTMAAFGLETFLDEAGCKVVFYLHRVARGVTLSTTCLLSGFQAMKLCPSISGWMQLKIKSPKCIVFCCFLCWILHLVLNISVVKHVTGPTNNKNMSMEKMYKYCSLPILRRLVFSVVAAIFLFTDGMFWGLMVWTSSFMVLFLYRHQQRVQHIHSTRLSPRTYYETRATCIILILVSMFVSFHALSSILSFWITQIQNPIPWLINISSLVSSGFPTFSPFVFIFSDTRVSKFYFAC
ncbi:PREDICTED: vomeronasal type-1 receptor 1-like [Galeopterus variegatus]|uniref:Vomeronasal type-1 receptor n=1 Tax=Galeopterus variegatus TaxID=482537 RepID=A0ABM0Q2T2_GALVR|nr:PREDICTED: vomeronasal type-1 receptor 1-like [Galeopterus variegatus]